MRPRWVIVPVMQKQLTADPRLRPIDAKIHTHLVWHAPATIRTHCQTMGMGRETVRRSIRRLEQHDWIVVREHPGGIVAIPWMPVSVEEKAVHALQQARGHVRFMGEWLMKCLLDLIAHDMAVADGARPEWLVSGDGTGSMELDRWYVDAGVAFEFQGPQHYRTGPLAPTDEELHARQTRDKLKAALCNEEGIRLIHVRAEDLDFATMRDKAKGLLELIPPRNNRPLFRYINQLCRSYINYANRD